MLNASLKEPLHDLTLSALDLVAAFLDGCPNLRIE
jgi:hypothetical protein